MSPIRLEWSNCKLTIDIKISQQDDGQQRITQCKGIQLNNWLNTNNAKQCQMCGGPFHRWFTRNCWLDDEVVATSYCGWHNFKIINETRLNWRRAKFMGKYIHAHHQWKKNKCTGVTRKDLQFYILLHKLTRPQLQKYVASLVPGHGKQKYSVANKPYLIILILHYPHACVDIMYKGYCSYGCGLFFIQTR